MTLPPADDDGTSNDGVGKARSVEGWALGVGLLILFGLLGHLLNQQLASKQTSVTDRESATQSPAAETKSAPEPTADAAKQRPTPRNRETSKPSQVVYSVAHKHRLRDCHGTLTFAQQELRFESDEPRDSFAVKLNEVTVEDDALRIGNKTWRFTFADGVSAARVFQEWKAGTLRAVSSR